VFEVFAGMGNEGVVCDAECSFDDRYTSSELKRNAKYDSDDG
jgi:hypothetical protein